MESNYWQRHQSDDFVVIGLNAGESAEDDARALARLFRDQHGLTYPILVDENDQVAAALKVEAFPTNIIIDREGNIHDSFAGFDERRLDKALRELDIL